MKRIVICAAAIGLLASAPLYAQNNDHHGDKQDTATPDRGKADRPASQQKEQQRPAANPATGHAAAPQNQPAQSHALPGMRDERQGQAARSKVEQTPNAMTHPGNAMQVRPPAQDQMTHANPSAARAGTRPDLNTFRRNMQAPKQFRGGNYRAPQGYRDHHWSYGERLPRTYFLRNYWISDFMIYGLFAPPADLIWVRVGNDALLIDRDSGDIVQVRYGLFY